MRGSAKGSAKFQITSAKQIQNFKSQIQNKRNNSCFEFVVFEYCNLFVICNLLFGILPFVRLRTKGWEEGGDDVRSAWPLMPWATHMIQWPEQWVAKP